MIRRHAFALAIAIAIALAIVLALDFALRDVILHQREERARRLIHETLFGAEYDRLVAADLSLHQTAPATIEEMHLAMRDGKIVAAAMRATAAGYGGEIVFVAAFNVRGELLQSRIVMHSEAPGLADFLSRADGIARAIDGVGGATITSNAVRNAAMQIGEWMRYNITDKNGGVN